MPPRDVRELLADLVAFRTLFSSSNLDCIGYIRTRLEGLGASCEVLPDETGEKASLVATVGPPVPGGIVLSGHTDVVPVEGQTWSHEAQRTIRVFPSANRRNA